MDLCNGRIVLYIQAISQSFGCIIPDQPSFYLYSRYIQFMNQDGQYLDVYILAQHSALTTKAMFLYPRVLHYQGNHLRSLQMVGVGDHFQFDM